MYIHAILMRKATFEVKDFKRVSLIKKVSDNYFNIEYLDDNDITQNEPFNPSVYNLYVLGVQ